MELKFKHDCVSITPSKTYLVRITDEGKVKCLGTYSTEEKALEVAEGFKEARLRKSCSKHGHELEEGCIVKDYYIMFDNGDIFSNDTGNKLKPGINGWGYSSVVLNGHTYRIHRLVAENFIPNPLKLRYVNHVDGDKSNNDMSNLEWCTQSDNVKHAFATGLKVPANLKGEDCPWSKLTQADVEYIRSHYIPRDKNFGQRALSKKYGVCQQMISNIILNKRWVGDNDENMNDNNINKKPRTTDFLYDYQFDAVTRLRNGCVLCGGVGSGKSRTALFYYFKENGGWITKERFIPMKKPQDLIIITTARKRDSLEWFGELANFTLYPDENGKTRFGNTIVVDSWNNIGKYQDIKDAFFLLDEQRLVSYGSWTKSFLKIAKNNNWILLSATPGDTYSDYLPIFLANGFYRNKSEFSREHIVYSRYAKFPKIDKYVNTKRLDRLVDRIMIVMDYTHEIVKHDEEIYCEYDIHKYKDVIRSRWDIYNDCPIQDAGGLCRTLRRVVNSDESRQAKLLEILEDHPRAIIFYNYNFERDILLSLDYGEGVEVAEWSGHNHQPVPKSEKWVYICQIVSSAEGWELTSTNCTIFYSASYSYKMMIQAKGRIDRLTTPFKELYYYTLKSRSGIDIAISKALRDKKKFNERKFAGWDK